MKKAIFLSFTIIIGSVFVFVAYDMLPGKSDDSQESRATPLETTSNEQLPVLATEPQNDTGIFLQYKNDFITFSYPDNLSLQKNPDDAAFLSLFSENTQEPLLLKAYIEETNSKTSDEYFSSLEITSFGVTEFPEGAYFEYVSEIYNDLPVMIHRRDFGGMLGEVNEMYVWLGNGKIVKFYAEPNHPALDGIFRSVSKP